MKKLLALALTITLICGYTSSLASEITFRNIPWWCSPAEFEQALKCLGFTFEYDHTYVADGYTTDNIWFDPDWDENSEGEPYTELPQYSIRLQSMDSKTPICYVAGYAVTNIYADFTPLYDVATNWIGFADQTILFSAKYQIFLHVQENKYILSYKDIRDDLYAKLSNLYGTPIGTDTIEGYTTTETTEWIASDGTSVRLAYTYGHELTEWIMVEYFAANVDEYKAGLASVVRTKHQDMMDNMLPNSDGL